MIKSLTKKQALQLDTYRDKWLAIGLSCEPCNLEESKKYARMAYKSAGLKSPKVFHLVDSPMAACELESSLMGVTKIDALNNQIFGSHDASWLSYYDYMINVLGIKGCEKLDGLLGLALHCGWWSPYEELVVFQHRHSELHLNADGRLHNESDAAVRYRDGYCVWAINGIRVNEQIVVRPETLTIHQIDSEPNLDVRSIMIERFGWPRYIKESNAKLLDKRDNFVENTKEALYKANNEHKLVVTCTTGRVFTLSVPSNIRTCETAQEWLGRGKFNIIGRT